MPDPDPLPPRSAASDSAADPGAPTRETVVLLTEEPVQAADAERILALHAEEDLAYRVLVPADTQRNLLAEVIDRLSLGQLREALDAVHRPDADRSRAHAQEVLDATLFSLRQRGRDADGELTADDPLPALEQAVAASGAREVIVVTRPHALEDTFHRDWASRARERLGVPVLHVYGGTTFLG